ncbi:MAG: tail fiber domain-containing protein [Phycisphaeraceae bacterium]|nr:tail fiber domain-containing protein [Phycisphaerales bacterium]QOJ18503.1 MAG: tail fiber domain-containing protein [Phycisphaeraceae bacterium]
MRGQRFLSVIGCGVLVSAAWGMALPSDEPRGGADHRPDETPSQQGTTLRDDILIYRGDLSWRGTPWSGLADLEFRLFASPTGIDPIGSPVVAAQWPVTDGEVLVGLDFGVTDPAAVENGVWMEVSVNGVILSPRRFIPAAGWSLSPGQVGSTGSRQAVKVDRELLDELESEERHGDEAGEDGNDSGETGGSLGGGAGSGGNGGGGAGAPSRPNGPGLPGGGFGGGSGGLGGGGWGNEGEMGEPDGGGWQLGNGFVWTTDRVGIGTSNPNSGTQLHVVSNKFKTLWVRNTNAARHAIFSNSGLTYLEGNVGLGTQTPTERLHLVGGTGRFENSATSGNALLGQSLAATGNTAAGRFENSSTSGNAVFAQALATSGITYGVQGQSASSTGRGVYGIATSTTGANFGGRFASMSTSGVGAHGWAASSTGNTIGVLGEVASPTGFSGYFTGPAGSRNYFQRHVGIGTDLPLAELHVANVSGNADLLIKRNDSTFGFNLGVSGTPTKLFMARTDGTTFTDILTLDGSTDRVGIGTTSPDSRLDVRGFANEDALRVRVDGATKLRVYSNGGVAIGSNPTTVPQDGLYVLGNVGVGTSDALHPLHVETASERAVFGSTSAVDGRAVYGWSSAATGQGAGVFGQSESQGGRGVFGAAVTEFGPAYGVYGSSTSTSGHGVFGHATSLSGSTFGVRGLSSSDSGNGVYGGASSTTGSTTGVRGTSVSTTGTGVLGHASNSSGQNFGVRGHTDSPDGYGGYFTGSAGSSNYFQRNVGIGVLSPTFQLQLSTNSAAKPTSSSWTISSDARLKKNIRTIDHALDDLLALRGVTYQWIDPASQGNMAGTYTGFIAQEVEPIFPEWISEDAEGFKRLTVIGFEGIVVEALRELRAEKDAQIAQRDAAIEQLRSEKDAEIAELRARLERLEKHLLRAGPTPH